MAAQHIIARFSDRIIDARFSGGTRDGCGNELATSVEVHMTASIRICANWDRPAADILARAKALPVANLSDVMHRLHSGGAHLRPMHVSGGLAGPALTVRCRPGDNLLLHKAIDMAQAGDVIVCDAGGDLTSSLMGELMLEHAIQRRVAGFVLNGAIRDADAFRQRNLPVFAVGVTHRGPSKDGPGDIGLTLGLNGMLVSSGDIVVGDSDGVLAIPAADAEDIIKRAEEKHTAEERQLKDIVTGHVDRSWIDRVLRERGAQYF